MKYERPMQTFKTDESIGLFCALYFGAEINKKRIGVLQK